MREEPSERGNESVNPRARVERTLVPMDTVDNGHFPEDSVSIDCGTLMSWTELMVKEIVDQNQ